MTLIGETMNIFYIIGVVVVILFVAGYFGLHAWNNGSALTCWLKKTPRAASGRPKHQLLAAWPRTFCPPP